MSKYTDPRYYYTQVHCLLFVHLSFQYLQFCFPCSWANKRSQLPWLGVKHNEQKRVNVSKAWKAGMYQYQLYWYHLSCNTCSAIECKLSHWCIYADKYQWIIISVPDNSPACLDAKTQVSWRLYLLKQVSV